MKYVYIIFLVCTCLAVAPVVVIWSLNALLGLEIAHTPETWLAVLLLLSVLFLTNALKKAL